jgi:hypothetical protein
MTQSRSHAGSEVICSRRRDAVEPSPVPPLFYLIDKRSLTGNEREFFENCADVFSLLRLDDPSELDILGIEPLDAGFEDGPNLGLPRL